VVSVLAINVTKQVLGLLRCIWTDRDGATTRATAGTSCRATRGHRTASRLGSADVGFGSPVRSRATAGATPPVALDPPVGAAPPVGPAPPVGAAPPVALEPPVTGAPPAAACPPVVPNVPPVATPDDPPVSTGVTEGLPEQPPNAQRAEKPMQTPNRMVRGAVEVIGKPA